MSEPKPEELPLVRVDNPFPLLDKMIERGTSPEALGKMMDLAERWKEAKAKEDFAAAMTVCQREMPAVVKDADNPHTKSRFASLEAVNTTIKPCYTKHGFSIMFGEEDSPIQGCCRVVADLQHAGGFTKRFHADIPLDGTGIKGAANMTGTQGKGSTFAYGRRYLTLLIFNVTVAAEDTDGNYEDDPPLTEKQIETINELICDLRDAGGTYDSGRFLAFMLALEKGEPVGDRTLGDAPNSMYGPGVENLLFKIKNARAKAVAK